MPFLPDEFQRWITASPGPASIVLPAPGANVRYLITSVLARCANLGTGGFFQPTFAITDPVLGTLFSWAFQTTAAAGNLYIDTLDRDITVLATPGQPVTAAFNVGAVNTQESIVLKVACL